MPTQIYTIFYQKTDLLKINFLPMQTKLSADGPSFSRIVAGVMSWGVWGADFSPAQAADYVQKCLDAGASDYIVKPIDTEQLLSLVRVWLYKEKT